MIGHRPYWRDVSTVDAFWEANMDLTHVIPDLNLYADNWPLRSLQGQYPPAKFILDDDGRRGGAYDSLVSSGCIVSGATVRGSILFTKVRVGDRSVVEDSVVLPDIAIGCKVKIKRAIVDDGCVIPDDFEAGFGPDVDRTRFHVTERGITLITAEMLVQPLHRGA
jgi:glucose-1-phosphate adenylyltransferase